MPDDDTTPHDEQPEQTPPESAGGEDAAPEGGQAPQAESGGAAEQSGEDAEVDAALSDAQSSVRETQAQVDEAVGGEAKAFTPPEFTQGADTAAQTAGIELLSDVNLNVKIELGRTRLLVEDVLRLGEGAVVELDKLAGDPVDIYVNERHVAKGEVLVLNDNFCVRVSEILEGIHDATREAAKD